MKKDPDRPRLYNDLARWWPLISPPEDYLEEAEILRSTLREKLGSGRFSLLDLGIGGGHHVASLTNEVDVVGVDLSPEMLKHSRRLNPSVEHHVGDMRTVRLGREFDAVLIHDAITYLQTYTDLRATLSTARAHLRPGGILVMCPDWFKENFPDGFIYHQTHSKEGTQLAYVEYIHDPAAEDTTAEVVIFILVKEQGGLQIEQDRHTVGLFSRTTWLELTTAAGFAVETQPFVEAVFGVKLELLVGRASTNFRDSEKGVPRPERLKSLPVNHPPKAQHLW